MNDPTERPSHSRDADGSGRSIGELLRDLATDASRLVREEISIAQAELASSGKLAARELALLGLAGALIGLGGLVLLGALVLGVGGLIGSYWLAALIPGVILAAVGAWASLRGVRLLRGASLAPEIAVAELGTTARWAGREIAELKASLVDGEPDATRRDPPPAAARVTIAAAAPAPRPERSVFRAGPPAAPPRVVPAGTTRRAGRDDRPAASDGSLLKRLKREILADDVLGRAAQLAFYAFLAMPPALMALFGAAGLIGSERFAEWLEGKAAVALPQAVTESIIQPFIEEVVLNDAPGPFSIGLLLALWGASNVFAALIDALNMTYDVEETRSWVRKRALALATMLGAVVLFLLAAVALLAGSAIARAVDLGGTGLLVWDIVQWPLAFCFIVGAFWMTYYVLPNRDQSRRKGELAKAAAIAAVGWLIATAAFRLYIANFSSYTEAYGFLGAFIILLLWLYLTGVVVLTGGELAAEMERGE